MNLPELIRNDDLSLDGTFLHGIDMSNSLLVHNVAFTGQIRSSDCAVVTDPGLAATGRPIDEIPIDDLRHVRIQGNVLSPRMKRYIFKAGAWANGLQIIDNSGDQQQYREGTKIKYLDTRTIEIEFEIARREFANDSPSRLSCIWLAENSLAGRSVIKKMFSQIYIAEVKVRLALKGAVADAAWFDEYVNFPKPEYLRKYWTGAVHPSNSMPEILVDGIVLFNSTDREHLKREGKLFQASSQR